MFKKGFRAAHFMTSHKVGIVVDIIYEKKIKLIVSSVSSLKELASTNNQLIPFKRTLSRLYELTMI